MLQTGLIVGGWDKHEGGKIYGVPLGGTILEQPFAIGGVFSSYDKNYPYDDSALITLRIALFGLLLMVIICFSCNFFCFKYAYLVLFYDW